MTDDNLKVGMKVELRPGMEEVYPRAVVGMRGVVRSLKSDQYEFSQAYIEWDKSHWRYNGESDGWTFATHFRPIQGVDDKEIIGTEIPEIPSTGPRIPTEEENERIEAYLNMLMTACDRASESDGFFFIALKRDANNHMRLDMLGATTDEELMALPSADLLKFAEEEMRRREEQ